MTVYIIYVSLNLTGYFEPLFDNFHLMFKRSIQLLGYFFIYFKDRKLKTTLNR